MQRVLTRRTFLEQAGATAASLTLVGRTARAQSAMFISLNGSVAPARTDQRPNGVGPWPEAARLAARIGYGGIDWSLGPAKTAGLEATRALFTELKIQPTIVGLPMNAQVAFGDEAAFKQALPQLADDAAFVAGVGCRRMMLVLTPRSDQPKDERRKIVRDRLSVIAEILAKSNIRLGLEFLGPLYMRMGGPGGGRGGAPAAAQTPPAPMQPFIWTLPETVDLGKDSGPNVGAVLDVWHWYHSGGTRRRHPRDRQVTHRPRSPLGCARDAACGRPRQHAADAGRRRGQPDRVPSRAAEDRLRRRRGARAAGTDRARHGRRGGRPARVRDDRRRDEKGGCQVQRDAVGHTQHMAVDELRGRRRLSPAHPRMLAALRRTSESSYSTISRAAAPRSHGVCRDASSGICLARSRPIAVASSAASRGG